MCTHKISIIQSCFALLPHSPTMEEDGQIVSHENPTTRSRSKSKSRSRSKSPVQPRSRSRSRSRNRHHRRRHYSPLPRGDYPRRYPTAATTTLEEHLPYKNDPARQNQFVRFMMQHLQSTFEAQEQQRHPVLGAIDYCVYEIRRIMADLKAKADKIMAQYNLTDQDCRNHFSIRQVKLPCFVNPPDHKILYQYYGKQLLLDRAPIMFSCAVGNGDDGNPSSSSPPLWRNDVLESVSFPAFLHDLRQLDLQIIATQQPGRYLLVAPGASGNHTGSTPTAVHMNPRMMMPHTRSSSRY